MFMVRAERARKCKSKCREQSAEVLALIQHMSLSIRLDYQFKLCCPSSVIITSELL